MLGPVDLGQHDVLAGAGAEARLYAVARPTVARSRGHCVGGLAVDRDRQRGVRVHAVVLGQHAQNISEHDLDVVEPAPLRIVLEQSNDGSSLSRGEIEEAIAGIGVLVQYVAQLEMPGNCAEVTSLQGR